MLVVGADGAKSGWVAVRLADDVVPVATLHESFVALLEAHHEAAVIAVDIPIGLPTSEDRKADGEARSFVRPRGSSVFSTPPRGSLTASTHREASALAKSLTGKGISRQSFALARIPQMPHAFLCIGYGFESVE